MLKKILLIEDDGLIIELLRKKLAKEGYEVFTARDGDDGLKVAREVIPDLILLDIIMPKMGGLEVMENMRRDEILKDVPVIVVSNSGQPVELDEVRRLGAKDWLIKTEFDPKEVLIKVKKQIG